MRIKPAEFEALFAVSPAEREVMLAEMLKRAEEHNAHASTQAARRRYSRVQAAKPCDGEKVDRAAIIARDNGVCYLCGAKPQGKNLTLDHVVAIACGGSHSADNLRVACRSCNSSKGARRLSDVMAAKTYLRS